MKKSTGQTLKANNGTGGSSWDSILKGSDARQTRWKMCLEIPDHCPLEPHLSAASKGGSANELPAKTLNTRCQRQCGHDRHNLASHIKWSMLPLNFLLRNIWNDCCQSRNCSECMSDTWYSRISAAMSTGYVRSPVLTSSAPCTHSLHSLRHLRVVVQ